MIVGIDEVGRGAWAGPLVVGAVLLGGETIEGLTDSKKLSKKMREKLDLEIRQKALGVGIGWVSAKQIDVIGLSEALKLASRKALQGIRHEFKEIIIDGTIALIDDPRVTLMKKADLLIPSVSAASIVAKVARDNYMKHIDGVFPGYKFSGHVGYGTAAHQNAIDELGVTPLHRLSFKPLSKYAGDPAPRTVPSQDGFAPGLTGASASGQSRAADVLTREGPSDSSPVEQRVTPGGQHRGSANVIIRESGADQAAGPASAKEPTSKQIGNAGEETAARYLWQLGHNIIDRNWRTKFCEIDIVSQHGDTIYFTEVKYRKNDVAGGGLAAITPKKQRQMKFAAELYALNHNLKDINLRLAAVDVAGNPPKVKTYLELS